MGKEKAVKVTAMQIVGWTIDTATSLWVALGPVWDTFKRLWDALKPIWDVIEGVYQFIKDYVLEFYNAFIKPLLETVDWILAKLDQVLKWIDDVYNATIGRIEKIYEDLFGKYEELWRRIEEAGEKLARVAGIFSKDLGESILKLLDELEGRTIGQIRDLRDEILGKIDDIYIYVRDKINDAYWAIKDLVKPIEDKVFDILDRLEISFEKPDLLRRETVTKTADTYGLDWWDRIMKGIEPKPKKLEVRAYIRGDVYKKIEENAKTMDLGKDGDWSDVWEYIAESADNLDAGADPASFNLNPDKLPEEELTEYLEADKLPDDPETIAAEE